MKEVKAFLHRNRVADVVRALRTSGLVCRSCHLSVIDVKGTLEALDNRERDFSLELGEEVITAVKLEVVCADEDADAVVELIRRHGRTGQALAGWVYVHDIVAAYPIDGGP
jgi:nitrogen regulatory protein P-II 1